MKGVIFESKAVGRTVNHHVKEHWESLDSPKFVKVNEGLSVLHYLDTTVDSIFILDGRDNIVEVHKKEIKNLTQLLNSLL